MTNTAAGADKIDAIIRNTVEAVQRGKDQIFRLGDQAREEYVQLQRELESLRAQISRSTARIGDLERVARDCRARLAEISQDTGRRSDEELRRAYQAAQVAQSDLQSARQSHEALCQRYEQVSEGVSRAEAVIRRSEEQVSAVGTAVEYLSGKTDGLTQQIPTKARNIISGQIIRAQEEERRRIAREIHDGPAQAMANIVLRAEICEKIMTTGKGDLGTELSELKRLVKDCLREVRRIIFDLRPMTLDDLGLVPTVTRYIEDLKAQTGLDIKLAVFGKEARLGSSVEASLFRFVQEALSNAKKYAQPKKIGVRIEMTPTYARAEVEDDGVGFDTVKAEKDHSGKDHLGIFSMRERVELLKGSFELISSPGKGTRVTAQIPLEKGVGGVAG